MHAFHSIWSLNKPYKPKKFEILTAVLSSLLWQKTNGKISMVCDRFVSEFLYLTGLNTAWNEIIVSLDKIPPAINPKTYWAAGKIFALSEFSSPIISIDTDFLVWKKLNFKGKLSVIHKEEINEVYPNHPDFLKFGQGLDFTVQPCNTAFFYINDNDFLDFYTKTSIDFMTKYNPNKASLPHMLFAEQRLFSMCAKKLAINIDEFSSLDNLFSKNNQTFTHLWGYKDVLRKSADLENAYCENIIKRIRTDFPEFSFQDF